jgi:hypothetical protein
MQIVTHFKGELLWLSIGHPLLHDEAQGLQGEPNRLEGDPPGLHERLQWDHEWLQGRLSLCSSKRTLTTLYRWILLFVTCPLQDWTVSN